MTAHKMVIRGMERGRLRRPRSIPLILRTTGHSDRREESLTKTTSFSLNKLYPVFIDRKYIQNTQRRYVPGDKTFTIHPGKQKRETLFSIPEP